MTERDLQRAIDRLTDAMTAYALARVRQALAIERDRADAEVAELRDELLELSGRLSSLRCALNERGVLHSVKVDP